MKKTNKFIDICIIFTVTVILLVLMELLSYSAVLVHRVVNNGYPDFDLPEQKMIEFTMEENLRTPVEYAPYVGYRRGSFEGEYLNIIDYKRKTENPCSSDDAIEIWFFGGSSAYGIGVSDEQTIPSYLSKTLCESGYSVDVTNFGTSGYTSTQELITYILELRKDQPDIVIFEDGHNDIYTTYQSNEAGLPNNNFRRELEFNTLDNTGFHLRRTILNTNTMKVIKFLIGSLGKVAVPSSEDNDEQLEALMNIYSDNFNTAKLISDERGIKFYFFFQPAVYTKKDLSEKEKEYFEAGKNPFLNPETYSFITQELSKKINSPNFIDITSIYDDIDYTIYIDAIHKGREGNEIEGQIIAKLIEKDLR